MKAVVDTNVLLVANGDHADISPECQTECVKRLLAMQAKGVTVIDDAFLILGEYLRKTRLKPAKGVGDIYLKWLLREAHRPGRVEQVTLTVQETNRYAEFPDTALEAAFDAADRKFAAVANAHADKPPILQAADCKWLDWWQPLAAHGIRVDFLCPADSCRDYAKKFRGKPVPTLPQAKSP